MEKKNVRSGWLYALTFWLETASTLFRYFVFLLITPILILPIGLFLDILRYLVFAVPTDYNGGIVFGITLFLLTLNAFVFVPLLAFGNLLLSFLAYLGMNSGWKLTRFILGAREPSRRENAQIYAVLERLSQDGGDLRGFTKIFVIDSLTETAYTVGTTLYLSSMAVDSEYLKPLMAHELGHVQNKDGGVVLALRNFIFPLYYLLLGNVKDFSTGRTSQDNMMSSVTDDVVQSINVQIPSSENEALSMVLNNVIRFGFALFGGGIGIWLTSWLWARYFREKDYSADKVAYSLGVGQSLIDYLEDTKFYDNSVPYMAGWRPANEQRIDRLLMLQEADNRLSRAESLISVQDEELPYIPQDVRVREETTTGEAVTDESTVEDSQPKPRPIILRK